MTLALSAGTDSERWIELFDQSREFTAAGAHDVRLVDIDADRAVLEMPIGDHARQPYGLLHGGVSMMLAESAASMHSCWGVDLTEVAPVGVEINGSHLSSAREGTVRAVCTVIKRGETMIRHHVEIIHVDSGRLLSDVRVTNFYKRLRS
ncbi:PaaI family thioesterase [Persicimonas caeni]|nr:PaaI family thioesterase [Persicimonas caeni]